MSEYQYYEFRTLDGLLTDQQIRELRGISTRADITDTSFINSYEWGDLKANPMDLMKRYFDAHVYISNWGSHVFMLKFPKDSIDVDSLWSYCNDHTLSAEIEGDQVILEFSGNLEGHGDYEDDGSHWSASLLPLRDALMNGDLRALYLGWLSGVWDADPDEEEPPVPPGLSRLNGPLESLACFLFVKGNPLVAAQQADLGAPPTLPTDDERDAWLANLPTAQKDSFLREFLAGDKPPAAVAGQLRRQFQQYWKQAHPVVLNQESTSRTADQILAIARELDDEEERVAKEKLAQAEAARLAKEAADRKRYLMILYGRRDRVWQEVDNLLKTTATNNYKRAVELLIDMREASEMNSAYEEWLGHVRRYRTAHVRKSALMERFAQAGFPS